MNTPNLPSLPPLPQPTLPPLPGTDLAALGSGLPTLPDVSLPSLDATLGADTLGLGGAPAAPAVAIAATPAQPDWSAVANKLQGLRQSLAATRKKLAELTKALRATQAAPAQPQAPAPKPTKPAPTPAPKPPHQGPAKPSKPEKPAKPHKPAEPKKPAKTEGKGPLLHKNEKGAPVKKLQERLKELGFDPGPADGMFGPKTLAAVKRFQRKEHIKVDGVVGPQTWGKLGIVVKGDVKPMPGAQSSNAVVHTPDGPMVRRQGHMIASSIAKNFDRMVADAAKAGVHLQINSAYRSYAEQVVLWNRYGHDTSRVARPGTSNHQKGTAIDFLNTPGAYSWLKAHASSYGLHNYPPEPWHYSPTGNGVPLVNAPVDEPQIISTTFDEPAGGSGTEPCTQ